MPNELPKAMMPADPSLLTRALFLQAPEVATLPGGVNEPMSVVRQQGWVDGARDGASRGLLVGAVLGSMLVWWAVKKR